jgi:hypothetical protein
MFLRVDYGGGVFPVTGGGMSVCGEDPENIADKHSV